MKQQRLCCRADFVIDLLSGMIKWSLGWRPGPVTCLKIGTKWSVGWRLVFCYSSQVWLELV